MEKTCRITDAYDGNKRIEAFENGKTAVSIIVNDYNVEGALAVLSYLGYRLTKRTY